jgi:thiol-disulfide isomerase/thioredoxin
MQRKYGRGAVIVTLSISPGALKAIHVVYANWCPHCVPTTVEPMKKAAADLGIPCLLYDIDTEKVAEADELVKKYGDWSEDYLIPQVFFELADGSIRHVLTGYPEGVALTRRAVENILKGPQLNVPKGA